MVGGLWSVVLVFALAGAPAALRAQGAPPCVVAPLVTELADGRVSAPAFLDSLAGQAPAPCVRGRGRQERGGQLRVIARMLAATAHVHTPIGDATPVAREPEAPAMRDTSIAMRLRALRQHHPVLDVGAFVPLAADSAARTFAFLRRFGADEVIVIVNAGDAEARLALPEPVARTPLVPIFASRGALADIPSLLLVYPESGPTGYAHPVPPRTAVVLRPAGAEDVRPGGLHE